jgi:hypothetical protein
VTGVITWAVRVITATATIGCGLWAAIAIRERFGREVRLHRRLVEEEAPRPLVVDDALAIVCNPCSGGSGRCTCAGKCGNWLCGAADTGIRGWSDDEIAYLRGELKELPRG